MATAQRDRRPPGVRPWYLSRDLAGLGIVSVLAVLAIAVLIFIRNPESPRAPVQGAVPVPAVTDPAPVALRLPADAAARPDVAAVRATGVSSSAVRLGVRGGVGFITAMAPDGTAVGRLDVDGASRAVRWDVSRPPGRAAAPAPRPVDLPGSLGGGDDPAISAGGLISYTATVKNLPVGRPAAIVHGRTATLRQVPHGVVVGGNADGLVLVTGVQLPFENGTGFSGMGAPGTGYLWSPATNALQRLGESGSRLLDDGSVLVVHPGGIEGQPRASLLWHDGTMSTLPEPVGWTAQVYGGSGWPIMAGTLIRGAAGNPQTDPAHAAAWHYGKLELLPGLGGRAAAAAAVNPAGIVVGAAQVPSGQPHAIRWTAGRGTDLGTLGGTGSWATAVGGSGLVAGWADTGAGVQHAVAWLPDGRIVDLGADLGPSTESSAQGVTGDQVFGSRTGPGGVLSPVVWNLDGV